MPRQVVYPWRSSRVGGGRAPKDLSIHLCHPSRGRKRTRTRAATKGREGQHTYGPAIRSASNEEVVEVQIQIEHGCVQLCLAIKPLAHPLPARRGMCRTHSR